MTEYVYRGFKVSYNVEAIKNSGQLYRADAYALCIMDNKKTVLPKKFHTEYSSLTGVQAEIKKMVEDYIDFEWKEYEKMHD